MYKIIFILIILLKFSSLKAENSLFFFVNSAVEKNLAACGNIFPKIKSVYKWDKKLQNDDETLSLIHI